MVQCPTENLLHCNFTDKMTSGQEGYNPIQSLLHHPICQLHEGALEAQTDTGGSSEQPNTPSGSNPDLGSCQIMKEVLDFFQL